MSAPPLRLALIGCGRAAERLHLPALAASAEAHLVAIADPSAARRESVVRGVPGCETFASADELFANIQVDGAIVATPAPTHVTVARSALRANVAVLMEKPLAPSVVEAETVLEAVRSSDVWMMMAFNRRFWPRSMHLRRILEERHAGQPARVECVLRVDPQRWQAYEERSDPLDDLFCHQMDFLRYLFGREVQTVRARWLGESEIRVDAAFAGGATACCVAGHGAPFEDGTAVHFEGVAYSVSAGSKYVQWRGPRPWGAVLDGWRQRVRTVLEPKRTAYDRQLAAFCAALRGRCAPTPDLTDGLAAVRVVRAARQSAAEDGREVLV